MKKTKLILKRQTIARLTSNHLSSVRGGISGSQDGNCSGTCHTCKESCETKVLYGCDPVTTP